MAKYILMKRYLLGILRIFDNHKVLVERLSGGKVSLNTFIHFKKGLSDEIAKQ